jgi:hypothetical protein
MRGQRWAVVAGLAIALANTGCVTCCHKGYEKSLQNGPECELPAPCRNQVYVFLLDGLTPPCVGGLGSLRTKLAENGFAKVGIADLAGGLCVEHEIKSIRACEPDAKFVLVGYDVGAPSAVCIARDLTSKGHPVEALVLLDPVGCKNAAGVPTLLVTTGKGACATPHGERVIVPDASHFGLPAHPTTVAVIVDLLRGVAASGYDAIGEPVSEIYAPAARGLKAEWDFLADSGPTRSLGTSVAAQPTAPVPAAPSPYAGAVTIKP